MISTKPHRFVPTLTDVVQADEGSRSASLASSVETPVASWQSTSAAPAPSPERVPLRAEPVDVQAIVTRACAQVQKGLDEQIRDMVTQHMQGHQLALVLSLREQMVPLIESMVREAVTSQLLQSDKPVPLP